MTTIIERDVSSDSGVGSAVTAIVAIVAILFVVGIALYMLRVYPFNAASTAGTTAPPAVNVNVQGTPPGTNSSGR